MDLSVDIEFEDRMARTYSSYRKRVPGHGQFEVLYLDHDVYPYMRCECGFLIQFDVLTENANMIFNWHREEILKTIPQKARVII
jgi:hypothetical protein